MHYAYSWSNTHGIVIVKLLNNNTQFCTILSLNSLFLPRKIQPANRNREGRNRSVPEQEYCVLKYHLYPECMQIW